MIARADGTRVEALAYRQSISLLNRSLTLSGRHTSFRETKDERLGEGQDPVPEQSPCVGYVQRDSLRRQAGSAGNARALCPLWGLPGQRYL